MVDIDHTYARSKIVSVQLGDAPLTGIYPNPASDKLLIGAADLKGMKNVVVRDHAGRIVLHSIDAKEGIVVKQLPAGLYTVTIAKENGIPAYYKVFKK